MASLKGKEEERYDQKAITHVENVEQHTQRAKEKSQRRIFNRLNQFKIQATRSHNLQDTMAKSQNSLLFKAAHTLIKSLKKVRAIASRIETKKIRAIGIILIAILTGFLIFNSTQKNKTSSDNKDYYEAFTLQEKENAESKFKTGIFIQKISAFDPQTKTFAADGYAWLKWKEPIDAWDEWDEGVRADPALTLEFLNAVEHWDFVKDSRLMIPI